MPVDVLESVVRINERRVGLQPRSTSIFTISLNSQSAIRSARRNVFLVTRAAWERSEFLIKRVGDSRSFPFLLSVVNYALLLWPVQHVLCMYDCSETCMFYKTLEHF